MTSPAASSAPLLPDCSCSSRYLLEIDLQGVLDSVQLPGSDMIPAAHAVRSLLALKILGKERTSHVMEMVFDPGHRPVCRTQCRSQAFLPLGVQRAGGSPDQLPADEQLERGGAENRLLSPGSSFDLDFHSIPANSEAEPLDKHYVSSRSRSQKGILAFLARDAEENVICYGNAGVPKPEMSDEILRFADYWKEQTGAYPKELVFDSRLTTYPNLQKLTELGISFIILAPAHQEDDRRDLCHPRQGVAAGHPAGADQAVPEPRGSWIARSHLSGYEGELRQIAITELGHEEPTILITNQLDTSIVQLITRYAQRMLIENGIADAINFFHMDALTSMVGLKVDFDLQLTLMAASLYRIMARRIGREYRRATAKTLFRKMFDVSGQVTLTESEIIVELANRAHNPFLVSAGLLDQSVRVPWLKNRTLRFITG